MKYLIVLAVVLVFVWLVFGRGRRGKDGASEAPKPGAGKPPPADKPVTMLACAHCGVHLPRSDAVADADGRLFCTDAHRLAGPR